MRRISLLLLVMCLLMGCRASGTGPQITLDVNPYRLEDASIRVTLGGDYNTK